MWYRLRCFKLNMTIEQLVIFCFKFGIAGLQKKTGDIFSHGWFLASKSIYPSIVLVLLVYDRSYINKSQIFTWNLLHLA